MRETFKGLVNPLENQNNSPVGEAPHSRLTFSCGGSRIWTYGSATGDISPQQKWVNVQNPWVYLHPRHLTPKSWFAKKHILLLDVWAIQVSCQESCNVLPGFNLSRILGFFQKLQEFFSGDIIEDDGLPIASMGRLYIYLHVLRFYQLKTHQLVGKYTIKYKECLGMVCHFFGKRRQTHWYWSSDQLQKRSLQTEHVPDVEIESEQPWQTTWIPGWIV